MKGSEGGEGTSTCRVLELCQVEDPVGVGHGRTLRGSHRGARESGKEGLEGVKQGSGGGECYGEPPLRRGTPSDSEVQLGGGGISWGNANNPPEISWRWGPAPSTPPSWAGVCSTSPPTTGSFIFYGPNQGREPY
jgi:hypothetical protein